jgi:hypothetical protein
MKHAIPFGQLAISISIFTAAGLSSIGCGDSDKTETKNVEVAEEIAKPPPPKPKPIDIVRSQGSAAEAYDYSKGFMAETFGKSSLGTLLFAAWAGQSMEWSDVDIKKDETSFGLAQKDIDTARGKRMCWNGNIIQISKIKELNVFSGLMMTSKRKLINYYAAKSTGELLANSRTRFCGYVTGLFDYSNSAGGTGHAIDMVGIFKLPENLK